jgi:hypothetical protein
MFAIFGPITSVRTVLVYYIMKSVVKCKMSLPWSHDSSVSIVTSYWLRDWGSIYDRGRYSSLVEHITTGFGAHLASVRMDRGALSLGVEADRSFTSGLMHTCCKAWRLLKDNVTLRQLPCGIAFCSYQGYQLAICQQYVTQEMNSCGPVKNL